MTRKTYRLRANAAMSPGELQDMLKPWGKGAQSRLARELKVDRITVSRWANGHQPISYAMALAIQYLFLGEGR